MNLRDNKRRAWIVEMGAKHKRILAFNSGEALRIFTEEHKIPDGVTVSIRQARKGELK